MFNITWKNILFLCLVSIPNTLFTFGILFIINSFISDKQIPLIQNLELFFFITVILSFILNIFFQKKIITYTYNSIYENELIIFKSLQHTSLSRLEQIGAQRIYSTVEDVRMFVHLPTIIVGTISSLMTLLICLIYYFILAFSSGIIIVSLIALLTITYVLINKRLAVKILQLRGLNEAYFKVVDDTVRGFKELKLSTIKSTNLFEKFLNANRREVRDTETTITHRYLIISLFSQYGLYILLGVILFVLPMVNLLTKAEAISFVIILLFIMGPLTSLINMQNYYTRAYVANKRITRFLEDVKDTPVEEKNNKPKNTTEIKELRFENITYQYQSNSSDQSFSIGPINLTIEKGETIFVIGGNGSGKSTFINCLTGIYAPTGGNVYLNNKKISIDNQDFRDQISAVFTDNHLFSRNYNNYSLAGNKEYEQLIKIMKLDEVVVDDKEESARQKFSKGQGKRMAMIFALLEECPILVLDEWAADQDPYFRKYFYEKLLPRLKEQGKTIIAVTHDDAYFKHADRIIKFEYGKIIKDIRVKEKAQEIEALLEI